MARQCIYCGRTLQAGETCNCRSAESHATGGQSSTPKQKQDQTKSAKTRKKPSGGYKKATHSNTSPFGSRRTTATRKRVPTGRIGMLFRRYAGFLRAPIDTAIEFASDTSVSAILLLVGIEAVAAAILGVVGSNSPVFYLSFTVLGFTLQGASSAMTAALFAGIQSFVRLGLLSGLLFGYLRLIVKRPVSFRQSIAAVAPASAPMAVFMLVASLSAVNATSLATLLLTLGMMTGFVFMFFTFRNLVRLPDNQTVLLLLFSHLLYFSVLSLLTGSLSFLT